MRQIKASEVKPGMKIRWEYLGIVTECKVGKVRQVQPWGGVNADTPEGGVIFVAAASPVTVLSEPGPEEPTAFGARVVAGGYEFLLSNGGRRPWKARLDGNRYSWAEVCGLGPVTIIDADPSWTLPAQVKVAPVVPERIEEWPEDDEALRAYRWRDCYKNVLDWNKTRWRKTTPSGYSFPVDAAFEIDVPCTRVTDA